MEGAVRELPGDERENAAHLEAMQRRELPEGWDADIPSFEPDEKGLATRKASNKVENAVAAKVPWLLAGAADLTGSNSVGLEGSQDFEPETRDGRQFHYGIREHESAAISNGLVAVEAAAAVVHVPDLLRLRRARDPALLADGAAGDPPLHPRLDRPGRGRPDPPAGGAAGLAAGDPRPGRDPPADANEVAEAWREAMDRTHQPVALVLTRQDVPILDRTKYASADGLRRGGYVLADAEGRAGGDPDRHRQRGGAGRRGARAARRRRRRARAWSACPAGSSSSARIRAYRDEVLPPAITARVSVEEASTLGWDRFVGPEGARIGMHTFGSSAPLKDVQTKFGFTPDKVAETAKEVLGR